MKKSLLLSSSFCLGVLSMQAQIIITTADVAVPSKIIYQANDTLPTVSVGSAGVSQTWNMSALDSNTIDTLDFLPYSWAPNAYFTSANIAVKQGYQNIYAYLINAAPSLDIIGNGGVVNFFGPPTVINQINSPAEKLATFPFTYNSTFINNFTTTTLPFPVSFTPYDSIRFKSSVSKTVLVDAWGNLTTPLGTYPVIRSKEIKLNYDTTDGHIAFVAWQQALQTSGALITSYSFWANGIGFPLVTVTMDSAGSVSKVQWLKAMPITGINEYTDATIVNAFPNPAQDMITLSVESSNAISIQVYDIAGRLISTSLIEDQEIKLNTSVFASGIYSYSIISKDDIILNRGKFVITK